MTAIMACEAGIHYVNMKAMLDTPETSYARLDFFADRVELHGTGRQGDLVLRLRPDLKTGAEAWRGFPSDGRLPRVAARPSSPCLDCIRYRHRPSRRHHGAPARSVSGCEWDTVQTFATIAPYTIEEAYEVADAIERGDMAELKDELGDLLLQVIFHSRMAEEASDFALADVADAISDKMERRHPHIFMGAAEGGHHLWEQIKASERGTKGHASALDGVAIGLPRCSMPRSSRSALPAPGSTGPTPTAPAPRSTKSLSKSRRQPRRGKSRKKSATCSSR